MSQKPKKLTTKEGLHLDASEPAGIAVTENKAVDVDNANAVCPELELAVLLPSIIQTDAHADRSGRAGLELERAAPDRGAVCWVAVRLRLDVANTVVRVEARGQVCVELAGTLCTPHETGRHAPVVAAPARAALGNFITVATICNEMSISMLRVFGMKKKKENTHRYREVCRRC